MMRRSELAAATVLLLVGGFTIRQARQLAYWQAQAPGPGFFPFWLGVLLTGAAAVILLAALRAPRAPRAPRASRAPGAPGAPALWIAVSSIAALILAPVVGMPTACGLFMAAVLFRLEPRRRRRNVVAAIATAAIVFLLFVYGLGVPLPLGPLGF